MMELEQKRDLETVTLWKRRQNPWAGLVFKVRLRNHRTQDWGRKLQRDDTAVKIKLRRWYFVTIHRGLACDQLRESEEDLWKGGQECKIPEVVSSTSTRNSSDIITGLEVFMRNKGSEVEVFEDWSWVAPSEEASEEEKRLPRRGRV